MATKKKSSGDFDVRRFCAALDNLIDSLPTEARKKELDLSLHHITEFLTSLQARLAGVPSREEVEGVRSALALVEEYARSANQSATVALILGQGPDHPRGRRERPLNEDEENRARQATAALEKLSINEVPTELHKQNRYSIRDLQGIARELGIKFTQKTNREALVHMIVTGISNFRGYQGLGGGPGEDPVTKGS
jgi:hypothetical protein